MKLKENTILITGGSAGIGLELARQLMEMGNVVIITGRDQARLSKAKEALPKLQTIQSDVSQTKDIEALFDKVTKEFPNLNMLINNAGIGRNIDLVNGGSSLSQMTEEIETNLNGPIRMTHKFLPFLLKKSSAAIVNVTSGLAFTPFPLCPVYCATKAGLHSFSLSLRVQLKSTKVKVFELAPPATQTELLGNFNSDAMKGVSIMTVEEMVKDCLNGMARDKMEIRPGQSNQLKFMSRLAPDFILNQMSKPVEKILSASKH